MTWELISPTLSPNLVKKKISAAFIPSSTFVLSLFHNSLQASGNKLSLPPFLSLVKLSKAYQRVLINYKDHLMQTCIALIDKEPLLHPRAHMDKGQYGETSPGKKMAEKLKMWQFCFLKVNSSWQVSPSATTLSLVKELKQYNLEVRDMCAMRSRQIQLSGMSLRDCDMFLIMIVLCSAVQAITGTCTTSEHTATVSVSIQTSQTHASLSVKRWLW